MRYFAVKPAAELLGTNHVRILSMIQKTPKLLKDGVVRIEKGAYLVDVYEMSLRFPALKQNPLGGKPKGTKPKPRIDPRKNKPKGTATGASEEKQRRALGDQSVPSDEAIDAAMDYTEARAKKEIWAAKTAKMNFQREAGKLIPAGAVAKTWTDIATVTQKSLLSVPDRIAPLLVGELDQAIIHKRITDEIRYALKNLSFTLSGATPQTGGSSGDD